MTRYTLTARRHGAKATRYVEADGRLASDLDIPQQEAEDFDATMESIKTVLDLALDDQLWAQGAIELTRPDGTVIHTMPMREND